MKDLNLRVLDELPIGVWVGAVPDGRVVYANRAFDEILGMAADPDAGIGDVPQVYGAFDRDGQPYPVDKLPFSRALALGSRVMVDDIVIHRRDGDRVPVRAFGEPVRDADGRVTHVIVAFLDIRVEAQMAAQHVVLKSALELVVDHAPLAYFCIDLDGNITLSQGAGLKGLGVKSGELVGKNVFELYADHPSIGGYMRRALAGESFWYTVDVGGVVFDSWLTPLRDDQGRVVGAAGVSNDVTEVRKLQAAAIQSDRVMAMGTLAASVAHEINNPLTYMQASFDQLERGLTRMADGASLELYQAEARRLLEMLVPVRQGLDRITTISRELRTFSRPDDRTRQPVDVRRVIFSVLTLVQKEIEARAQLHVSAKHEAIVLGNEARLVQVVTNLMMNALQALPEDAGHHEICVSVRKLADRVVIEVGDSGSGVLPRDRERIFEPFVSTKPIGVGTGLGLFVSRNIVRELGGEVSVLDRPGGGALFRVELPAATELASRTDAEKPAPRPLRCSGRVLIVDDDPRVADSLAACLRATNLDVETALVGRRALERLLGGEKFDLVYCDLMMNGMTGMDFAEELRSQKPELLERVVFMTGGAFTGRAAVFADQQGDRIVEKPFDIVADAGARLGEKSSRPV